jgi:hypothetical protein
MLIFVQYSLTDNTKTFIIDFKRKREKAQDKVKDFMFDGKCLA